MDLKSTGFKGVDIAKFVMAIFVVAIHTLPFFGSVNNNVVDIFQETVKLAVPYFFMASGYFLFLKIYKESDKSNQLKILKIYGKRIFKLYLYWTIIYLPITIIESFNNNIVLTNDVLLFVRGILLVGESYYSWPLWYLLSMIYSLVIIYFLFRLKFKISLIFGFSIIVYIASIVMNYVMDGQIIGEYASASRNLIQYSFGNGRIFSGMLYIMIGAMLARPSIKIQSYLLVIFVIFGLYFQLNRYLFISEFGFILLRTVVFIATLKLSLPNVTNNLFYRKCSTVMYFLHMIIFYIYILLCKKVNYFGMTPFLLCTLIPIALTPLVLKYEKNSAILQRLF